MLQPFTAFDLKIDFEKSQGSYLFDKNSKRPFLDFHNMYSSIPIGYNHPVFDSSFEKEVLSVSKIRNANNVFQSDELNSFIETFRPYLKSDFIHFCCTGALAVESAIKCAISAKKSKNPMVLAVSKSFHGVNSWGFLTDRFGFTQKRLEDFPSNNWKNINLDEIELYLRENDCNDLAAVIVEPIQCTNGDLYLPAQSLKTIEGLCKSKNVCFIIDEIQTGFGTTGKFWYYDKIGLDPDILIFGKKSQICGINTNEKYSECITGPYMKLQVTFDGDLIDAIRSKYILKAYQSESLVERANENSSVFKSILENKVLNYRSSGHLIAFDFTNSTERDQFLSKCKASSFLCNSAGEKSIRMRPNLAISPLEIQHFREIMANILL